MKGWTAQDGELKLIEREDPAPGPGEVRIRVRAAGVNRADLMQRAGNYPPPPGASDLLGLECSGTLEAIGDGAQTALQPGQQVCALLAGGGYAEVVLCPAEQVLPVPPGVDLVEAGGLAEVFATAWLNLFIEGAMQPGEKVLVHAGGSGVGTAAVQLCRAFGSDCFVTAGTEDKIARCRELGAVGGAVRDKDDWAEAVRNFAPEGVDLVLDPVGAAYLKRNLELLAVGGRLVLISVLGGRKAEIDLLGLLVKRQRLIGSALRTRTPAEKGHILAELEQKAWPLFQTGDLRPVTDKVFPWQQADRAHNYMAENANFGKILLEFPPP